MSREIFAGVDIGGTFTDLVIGESGGALQRVKVLTDHAAPEKAVLAALEQGLGKLGCQLDEVGRFVHATTLSTNLVLERRGARVAYVTTEGFGDMFAISKQYTHGADVFDLLYRRPAPFVSRDMIFELPERISAAGEPLKPLPPAEADRLAGQIAARRPEAVAICLLHSYVNAAHEKQFAAILKKHVPDAHLSLSSEIWPESGEYERGATTLISAYIGPTLADYVTRLDTALQSLGMRCPLQIMQSSGGIVAAADAARRAAFTLESGPAAGVVSIAHLGRVCGRPRLISFDMGGTTAKAGLVENGKPRITHDFRVGAGASANDHGAGEPIRLPVIDLAEIGAGGGSIARVDAGGFLKIGPQSAGSTPGPACYGRGGELPTVTDANLVLGYLNPARFAGGSLRLDAQAAMQALQTHVADPLGISPEQAAWRIHQLANTTMGSAVRIVTIQRGIDPRDFELTGFGGAGPLHAARVAEEFDISTVLIPPYPGVRSAFGLLVADLGYDYVRSAMTPTADPDLAMLDRIFDTLDRQAGEETASLDVSMRRSLEIRFTQQALRIRVDIEPGRLTAGHVAQAEERFRAAYWEMCAIRSADSCQIVSCWVQATATVAKPISEAAAMPPGVSATAPAETRRAFFPETSGFSEVPVLSRTDLAGGETWSGPIFIEEPETTTVVPPGWAIEVDRHGNLRLARHS